LVKNRHCHHVAARPFRCLADAIRHCTRLANADADTTFVVADNNRGTEGETATTLDYLRNAGNVHHSLIEFFYFFVLPFSLLTHLRYLLELQAAFTSRFC
jgi:hypothetical protein